jgi:hypothetical protein
MAMGALSGGWSRSAPQAMDIAPDEADPAARAYFIDAPADPKLQRLFGCWTEKRGARQIPRRSDLHPRDIKFLLPDVQLWNAQPPHIIRLTGDNIVKFDGMNYTGQPGAAGLPPHAVTMFLRIIDRVLRAKEPVFRAGKAYWNERQAYRNFEACYLPLSDDAGAVSMILGGYIYDMH